MGSLAKFSILLIFSLSSTAWAGKVIRRTKRFVLLQLDKPQEFVVGDQLYVLDDGEKAGTVLVTKVRKKKAIAVIQSGTPPMGAKVSLESQPVADNKSNSDNTITIIDPPALKISLWSADIALMSTNIWRGLDSSAGLPLVFGRLNFTTLGGLNWGLQFYNAVAPVNSQADYFLGYNFNGDNGGWNIALYWYTFPNSSHLNSIDGRLGINWGNWRMDFSYIPDFFNSNSPDLHSRLGYSPEFMKKVKLIFQVGHSSFAEEQNVGFKSYVDYKVGLKYLNPFFDVELAFSNTFREDIDGKKLNDEIVGTVISKTF